MKNKWWLTICAGVIALAGLLLTLQLVQAGQALDAGWVPGLPPPGAVNWTAWLNKHRSPNTWPSEVMTEDNTNSSEGINWGYQIFDTNPLTDDPRWIMQVENYRNEADGDLVEMILGGLGDTWSGYLWDQSFNWDYDDPDTTLNGFATQRATGRPCPVLGWTFTGSAYNLSWTGENGLYKVYRSQNYSGAEPPKDGSSNGYYFYVGQSTAAGGAGSYSDTSYDPDYPAWYIVIHADGTGALDGCHSEDLAPLAVDLSAFEASAFINTIQVQWTTGNELDLFGFNLFRRDNPSGELHQLNAALIEAQNFGSALPGDYLFPDTFVQPGVVYEYWPDMVDRYGEHAWKGPQFAQADWWLYMPMLKR